YTLRARPPPGPTLFPYTTLFRSAQARETRRIERAAMEAVTAYELALGFVPHDVSAEKCGYDIESQVSGTGKLRFIEVKGRVAGRSEEHTSELQSRLDLVCRLLLE